MKTKEHLVYHLDQEAGRLDKVLTDLTGQSRSKIQKWIKDNRVKVDDQVEKANYKLVGDEKIEVWVPYDEVINIEGEAIPLNIIYEDEALLVVNKPAGMVVHPSKGHPNGTLVNSLVYHFGKNLSSVSEGYRPGLVHRIDKDTSGLLVVAKNDKAHQALALQLQDHSLGRHYLALVHGSLEMKEGSIEVPLARDPKNRLKYHGDLNGKDAWTDFEVLEVFTQASLVQAKLKTGRTHQIRAHFEHIGHPLVGDPVYSQGVNQVGSSLASIQTGQYLHANEIHFTHPETGKFMSFQAPLPSAFEALLGELRTGHII